MALDRLISNVDTLMTSRGGGSTATDISKPGAMIRDSRTVLPVNPWKMRAHLQNTQTLANATTTTIPFDQVDVDSVNGWDPTTFEWVIPLNGQYRVTTRAQFDFTSAGFASVRYIMWLALRRSGTLIYYVEDDGASGDGAANSVPPFPMSLKIDDMFDAQQGDRMRAEVWQTGNPAHTVTITGGGTLGSYSFLTAHLLSG